MLKSTSYQMRQRCVMDTTSALISFDENGICNFCTSALERLKEVKPATKEQRLIEIVGGIKRRGQGKGYDCIIGISGVVDSSYVAYLVKNIHELRPLTVYLDNGWDSELAVKNIEELVRRLDIELHTVVLDWEEFRSLQLAFLRSGTPNIDIPSDHAIFATLYKTCRRERVGFLVTGMNAATEAIMPADWSWSHFDSKYITTVNRQFGERPLKNFLRPSLTERVLWSMNFSFRVVDILNYIDFDKNNVEELLINELGWRRYEQKHYESSYTKFFQGVRLSKKFGIDKRRAHQSSIIFSRQTTRDVALAKLQQPAIDDAEIDPTIDYVAKKLTISVDELRRLMAAPNKTFSDYRSQENSFYWPILRKIQATLRGLRSQGAGP